jgi:hypothetical protein
MQCMGALGGCSALKHAEQTRLQYGHSLHSLLFNEFQVGLARNLTESYQIP